MTASVHGSVQRSVPATAGHRLEVTQAVKRFGATTALSGVDLTVEPGEFLVLLGPSGSGKSTLVRALAGIERLDAGRVRLSGQLVADGNRHLAPEHRNLAMVFQDYALWPHLTVEGNVGYALRRRRLDPGVARARIQGILERVGLGRHGARYPHELSGGEQQRVALARAVVAEPQLLLFDEPLSNLDADLRERLRVEIATLTRESGATAIYITHDQTEAFALADTIGVLDHGELLQLAAPEDVYRRPATPFVARFTGVAGELVGTVVRLFGETGEVRVGDLLVRVRCLGPLVEGEVVRVVVRPAATSIVESGGAATGASGCGVLAGIVTDVAYRGRGYDHVVAAGPWILASVHASRAHPRGSAVDVVLDPEHCVAFADADAARYIDDLTAVTIMAPRDRVAPEMARRLP
jgi:ABC-type Fe3+/spermidine/putrescine transport system ATPase subunit